jgi:hypothetical protein
MRHARHVFQFHHAISQLCPKIGPLIFSVSLKPASAPRKQHTSHQNLCAEGAPAPNEANGAGPMKANRSISRTLHINYYILHNVNCNNASCQIGMLYYMTHTMWFIIGAIRHILHYTEYDNVLHVIYYALYYVYHMLQNM